MMDNPMYNAIVCYIIIVSVILLMKPQFIYCEKTQRFKSFGFDEGHTVLSFPIVSIGTAIVAYLVFVCVDIFISVINRNQIKLHSNIPS